MIHRGTYDGTIYYNPANKFCIISVKTAEKDVPEEARSIRRRKDHLIRFVATGYELPRTDAVELELDGEWKKGKYGMQLQVEQWHEIVPQTKSGVEGYLASGLRNESEKNCEALRRIVQAELMGQFYKLKYFAGDLKQEIHYPIQEAREDVWKQNLSLTRLGLMAKEVDDFYHTIRMGELPHFTCLSCYQGSQRDCLLAAFDSNKKIILVYKDESVVARACLRLTKGSFQQPSTLNFEFADLSKEDVPTGSHAYSEKLVLFLEHIYTSGLKKSEETAAKEMVVALATQKAEELDAVAVLSNQYRGCYPSGRYVSAPIYIYISKSKNGRQYLDSLGGAAVTLAEEQYKQESFFVERAALDRAHAA